MSAADATLRFEAGSGARGEVGRARRVMVRALPS
jgi:hypothetical protein